MGTFAAPFCLENFAISNGDGLRGTYWEVHDRVQSSIIEGKTNQETVYHFQPQVTDLLISANSNTYLQLTSRKRKYMV